MLKVKNRKSERISLCLAALLAAFALVAFTACGQPQKSSSSAVSESAGAIPVAEFKLENADNRALLNERLSWMSQAFYAVDAVNLANANDQVAFALHYLGLTDYGTWEFGDYTAIAGPGGGANGSTNVRVATGHVNDVVKDFFGTEPDYSALNGIYKSIDDYVYFGVTAPVGQSAAYSAATGIEPLGDGLYSVPFEIYSGGGLVYQEQDTGFYSLAPSEMMASLGIAEPQRTGKALVRLSEQNGKTVLVFESYELDARNAPKASGAPPNTITTSHYTITIPDGWPAEFQGQYSYSVNEETNWATGAPNLGICGRTEVVVGNESFHVYCFTDVWGPQGDFAVKVIGTPGNLPGWRVVAFTARTNPRGDAPSALSGLLDEFSSFITLAPPAEAGSAAAASPAASGRMGSDTSQVQQVNPAPDRLTGKYAMAKNHTIEFSSDGTCIVQDNGVSWQGSYKYDASKGVYAVVVNGLGGSVQAYEYAPSGDDLILRQNGYEFVYEKQ